MKIIGIAGGSGSGKTTIAHHLAQRGGGHVDADAVGHELLDHDEAVRQSIRERFGDAVFAADGATDRAALGEVVFNDPEALAGLGTIIHPPIRRRCGELIRAAEAGGAEFAVVDGALLLDSQMPFRFDMMIALRIDGREQKRRLMAKGGWSEEQLDRRLGSQGHIEKSFYKADVVIDTGRQLSDVLSDIDDHVDRLLGR